MKKGVVGFERVNQKNSRGVRKKKGKEARIGEGGDYSFHPPKKRKRFLFSSLLRLMYFFFLLFSITSDSYLFYLG